MLFLQLLFFTMCEMAMMGLPTTTTSKSEQPIINGLSSLLFYTVFGYFVARIQEICANHYTLPVQMNYSPSSYIKWILKIILEWSKAIGVVLCVSERHIMIHTNLLYNAITFTYYLSTEKLFTDLFIKLATSFKLQVLEGMELLYVPIALNTFAITASALVTMTLRTQPQLQYAMFASYFTLYLRTKFLYQNYIRTMRIEQNTFASFKWATDSDLQKWDDICAVCLTRMSKAKITPCNHLFHSACLRQCLRNSLQCPLCKHDLIQQQ